MYANTCYLLALLLTNLQHRAQLYLCREWRCTVACFCVVARLSLIAVNMSRTNSDSKLIHSKLISADEINMKRRLQASWQAHRDWSMINEVFVFEGRYRKNNAFFKFQRHDWPWYFLLVLRNPHSMWFRLIPNGLFILLQNETQL